MVLNVEIPSTTLSEIEQRYWAWFVCCAVTYAAFAVMLWDMALTMGDEVRVPSLSWALAYLGYSDRLYMAGQVHRSEGLIPVQPIHFTSSTSCQYLE
jgi:hypothetical protein